MLHNTVYLFIFNIIYQQKAPSILFTNSKIPWWARCPCIIIWNW